MKPKNLLFLFLTTLSFAQTPTIEINKMLDNWHKAAADARFNDYMRPLAEDATYIGTDATENWTKPQFMVFAKPYFDKGKAWNFSVLKRTIYFSSDKKTAWFDELLDTQMKICRGSGVLTKKGKIWKIKHYVLSMTIPNENSSEIIKTKSLLEDALIEKLKRN